MSTLDEIREQGALAWFYDSDLPIVLVVLAGIYVLYGGVAIVLGYPFGSMMSALSRLTFLMAIYAMAAVALNLHWGYTGLFNIGIAGFMAVGVYVTVMLSTGAPQGPTDVGGLGLPLVIGIVLGVAAAGFAGFIIGLPAMRLRADYFAIVTLAASEVIRLTANSGTLREFSLFGQTVGTNAGSGVRFSDLDPIPALLGRIGQLFYDADTARGAYDELMLHATDVFGTNPAPLVESLSYSILLLLVLGGMYWLLLRTGRSPFGRVLKAIRDDEEVANSLGKNVTAFKLKAFVLGCALMGLVGILWRLREGYVDPDRFLPNITFYIWIALIIGGVGSNTGSIIGGLGFVALLYEGPRYFNRVVNQTVEVPEAPQSFGHMLDATLGGDLFSIVPFVLDNVRSLQFVIMGVVLILILQRRPDGFLGHRVEEAATIDLGSSSNAQDGGGT